MHGISLQAEISFPVKHYSLQVEMQHGVMAACVQGLKGSKEKGLQLSWEISWFEHIYGYASTQRRDSQPRLNRLL